jgi:hypothetical protein
MAEPIFYSIKDAAIETGLSQYAIRNGVKDGTVPHIKRGEKYYINMPLFRRQLDGESLAQIKGGMS